MEYDKLLQKYLGGNSSREEEQVLLDYCLRGINDLLKEVDKIKIMRC